MFEAVRTYPGYEMATVIEGQKALVVYATLYHSSP